MKKNIIIQLILGISLLFIVSCKKEVQDKPKVNYDSVSKTVPKTETQDKKIILADLPIEIDGINEVIYPVGSFSVSKGSSKVEYSKSDRYDFTISNYSEYEIAGKMSNLKFQSLNSDSLKVLTTKPVMIERIAYLKPIADKLKKQYFIYNLVDKDSNKDGNLDESDIKSLYMSAVNGENFSKLTLDYQELIDWNLIVSQNKIYFRTIEDSNKNGAFATDDKLHYYYLDLSKPEAKPIEYFPVD
jgi:hypothetical protein